MWTAQPILFDDEDEAALKARFVELWAKYPERSIIEIGDYIFKDLKNPETRGAQWAMIWAKDLDVLEAVKHSKQGRVPSEVLPTKGELVNMALAIVASDKAEEKDKIAAIKLIAEMQSMIEKNVNKNINETSRRVMPKIVFERYDDE